MDVELCNMCMISGNDGQVLVLDRSPTATDSWAGLTFPGGHVEPNEDIVTSVIREVKEETGLTVWGLSSCGYIEWSNPTKKSHYLVFLFRTSDFTGELISSAEGRVSWMSLPEMLKGGLAPNMEKYLHVFCEDSVIEAYGISGETLNLISQNGEKSFGVVLKNKMEA